MKRLHPEFLTAIFLLCTTLNVHSSNSVQKTHNRSRRCICVTITSFCNCYGQPQQPVQQMLHMEEPLPEASVQEAPTSSPAVSVTDSSTSLCFTLCLRNCVQKEYSYCHELCQNICRMDQQPLRTDEQPSNDIPQQPAPTPTYSPLQYEPLGSQQSTGRETESGTVQPTTSLPEAPISEMQSFIPFAAPSANTNICIQTCMPSCQSLCSGHNNMVPLMSPQVPVMQQPMQEQAAASLQYQPIPNNHQIPQGSPAACASICISACNDRCLYSLNTVPEAPVQSIPETSAVEQPEQQEFSVDVPEQQKIDCRYSCHNECMQQCVNRGMSAAQCSLSCNFLCAKSCEQRQQMPLPSQEVSMQQELPPVEQQQVAGGQEEEQQLTAVQNQVAESVGKQLMSCLQQSSSVVQCVCPAGYQSCKSGNVRGCCRRK